MVNAEILAEPVGFYENPIVALTVTHRNQNHSPLVSGEVEFIIG